MDYIGLYLKSQLINIAWLINSKYDLIHTSVYLTRLVQVILKLPTHIIFTYNFKFFEDLALIFKLYRTSSIKRKIYYLQFDITNQHSVIQITGITCIKLCCFIYQQFLNLTKKHRTVMLNSFQLLLKAFMYRSWQVFFHLS